MCSNVVLHIMWILLFKTYLLEEVPGTDVSG